MDSDDAADFLSLLDEEKSDVILNKMKAKDSQEGSRLDDSL